MHTPQDIDGRPVKLNKYKGKVVLVVNLASACGFTPQYAELQELQNKYGKGFTVLGFPVSTGQAQLAAVAAATPAAAAVAAVPKFGQWEASRETTNM
jgi:glutathione peroxidase-family protein